MRPNTRSIVPARMRVATGYCVCVRGEYQRCNGVNAISSGRSTVAEAGQPFEELFWY